MRILIVSNLYPPHYLGGYELHCARVAERLVDRGHIVTVLTSDYGAKPEAEHRLEIRGGVSVRRQLRQYAYGPQPIGRPWTVHRALDETRDVSALLDLIGEVQPDVLNWWNLNGISKLLPAAAEAAGLPSVYQIEDRWLIQEYGSEGQVASRFWHRLRTGGWVPRFGRPLARLVGETLLIRLRRMGVDPSNLGAARGHACFLSAYLQRLHEEAGISFDRSEVIRGGVQADDFWAPCYRARYQRTELGVLYVGQVTEDRAVHTVVEALAGLNEEERETIRLTIAGDGPSDYVAKVRKLGERVLGERIALLGKVPYESIPDVYRRNQLLVFSSTRPEGLGFTMIEAMLAGCAVVTSGSGGAEEVAQIADLPVFAPGDAEQLRRILRMFASDRERLATLATRGQRVAQREFGLDVMVDRFVHALDGARMGNAA